MAKKCCICDKSIGFMDSFKALSNDQYTCDNCYGIIAGYMEKMWNSNDKSQIDEIKAQASEAIKGKEQELKNPQILLEYVNYEISRKMKFIQARESETEKQDMQSIVTFEQDESLESIYSSLRDKLLLTTAGTLEGYRITKQLGIVFGETVFKPSFGRQIAANISDTFRSFAISSKEMKGQVAIIEEARQFAYIKMMKSALNLGANAIIAIDSDNTIGENICYLSLYGTAVYVEPDR